MGVWELITGALGLSAAAFQTIASAENGTRQALLILLLAGASETIGQSVVLVLNRVSRGRFALALLLGGIELVVEASLWVLSVWFVGGLLTGGGLPLVRVVRVVGLAYAPLIFGVLIFFPYIGPAIGQLLRVWVLLAAIVGISVAFGVRPLEAAVIAALGFVGRWLVLHLFASAWQRANDWRWSASTGRAVPMRSSESLLSLGPRDQLR